MFRMFFNTFHGECRASEEVKHHIHESPKVMTIPLMILAVLSIVGGYVGVPAPARRSPTISSNGWSLSSATQLHRLQRTQAVQYYQQGLRLIRRRGRRRCTAWR